MPSYSFHTEFKSALIAKVLLFCFALFCLNTTILQVSLKFPGIAQLLQNCEREEEVNLDLSQEMTPGSESSSNNGSGNGSQEEIKGEDNSFASYKSKPFHFGFIVLKKSGNFSLDAFQWRHAGKIHTPPPDFAA